VKGGDRILESGEFRRRLVSLMARDTATSAATVPDLTTRLGETERRIARLARDLTDARARSGRQPGIEAAVEGILAELANLPRGQRLPHLDERAAILVEAVGIEPTSGNPQPQASTPISGLS